MQGGAGRLALVRDDVDALQNVLREHRSDVAREPECVAVLVRLEIENWRDDQGAFSRWRKNMSINA